MSVTDSYGDRLSVRPETQARRQSSARWCRATNLRASVVIMGAGSVSTRRLRDSRRTPAPLVPTWQTVTANCADWRSSHADPTSAPASSDPPICGAKIRTGMTGKLPLPSRVPPSSVRLHLSPAHRRWKEAAQPGSRFFPTDGDTMRKLGLWVACLIMTAAGCHSLPLNGSSPCGNPYTCQSGQGTCKTQPCAAQAACDTGGCADGSCGANGPCGAEGCDNGGCDSCGCHRAICGPNMYCDFIDRIRVQESAKHRASKALRCTYGTFPKVSCHYAHGFEQAYIDLAEGGDGTLPAIAPQRYWHCTYRGPAGHACANEWFAGYEAGVASARASNDCLNPTVPTSPTAWLSVTPPERSLQGRR